jgi:NADH-quinone oxidoreductase subunit G
VQRGNRSVIDTFFDDGVEGDLFAGNIVDICPVGALLSKDFLHKARVWDLDNSPSVCPSCSQGCNVKLDARDNMIARVRPRLNPDVNSYWMCDHGRYNYEWINEPDRIETPLMRAADGSLQATGWHQIVVTLVDRLKLLSGAGVRVVGSPVLGNEDNGLLARLGAVMGGGDAIFRSPRADDEVVCPGFPGLARRRDLAANVRGLELLGFTRAGDDEGHGGLGNDGGALFVLGDALADQPADFGAGAALFVYMGHRLTAAARNAHFVLPVSLFAEGEGTFTNFEGRVQRFWPGVQRRRSAGRPGRFSVFCSRGWMTRPRRRTSRARSCASRSCTRNSAAFPTRP